MDYNQIRMADENMVSNDTIVPIIYGSCPDNQFFKVVPESMKYTFNSPAQSKSLFPSPYSSKFWDTIEKQNIIAMNSTNSYRNNTNTTHVTYNYDTSFNRNPDLCPINTTITNTLNPNTNIKRKKNIIKGSFSDKSNVIEDTNAQSNNTLQSNYPFKINNSSNNNMNSLNVSNVNNTNNNNNIHTDFLLPSPVQLGEWLYDSPDRISFFHNTPARSPLKFVTEEFFTDNNNNKTDRYGSQQNGSASLNLTHLFNSANNTHSNNNNNNNNNNMDANKNINQNNNNNTLLDIWDRLSNNTRTPIRKIDINLTLNNGQLLTNSNSLSPLKNFSMSLTPYGRKILSDLGTPFNHTPNLNVTNNNIVTSSNIKTYLFGGTSNSIMIDYQRARKDTIFDTPHEANSMVKNNLMIMSPSKLNSFDIRFKSPKLIMTPKRDKRSNMNGLNDTQVLKLKMKNSNNIHDDNQLDSIDQKLDTDAYMDESSPTTIQLNSSVTKSFPRVNRNSYTKLSDRIPLLSRKMSPLQKVSLDMSFSPTPRSTLYTPIDIKSQFPNENRSGSNKLTFLPVPDLPKMGSFKSERTASTLTNNDISIDSQDSQTSLSKLPSITTFPSTKILPPQVQSKKGMIKKKKSTKVKKPKFQIFVSSIHKFNDPNSSVPVTSLKHGNHNRHSTNHKASKRKKK